VQHILTLNAGSSSLKFALFELTPEPVECLRGEVEGLGAAARLQAVRPDEPPIDRALGPAQARDHATALAVVLEFLQQSVGRIAIQAVGHLNVVCGGIGEKAWRIREQIRGDFEWLGIELDHDRNQGGGALVSANRSRVRVLVIPTNEELMIARHAACLLVAS
jgi:acetate kinase